MLLVNSASKFTAFGLPFFFFFFCCCFFSPGFLFCCCCLGGGGGGGKIKNVRVSQLLQLLACWLAICLWWIMGFISLFFLSFFQVLEYLRKRFFSLSLFFLFVLVGSGGGGGIFCYFTFPAAVWSCNGTYRLCFEDPDFA